MEKSPLNPNAAEWPARMLSDLKNAVSGAQSQRASVEVKKQMTGERVKYASVEGYGHMHKARNSKSVQIPRSVMSNASFR